MKLLYLNCIAQGNHFLRLCRNGYNFFWPQKNDKFKLIDQDLKLLTNGWVSPVHKIVFKKVLAVLSFTVLIAIFSSCKKCHFKEVEYSQVKAIKFINTSDGQFEQNLVVNYGSNGQVSYVGLPDFTNGYTYKYQGSKISNIQHRVGMLNYEIDIVYSNDQSLSEAKFNIKKAEEVIMSIPLTCTKNGDVTLLSTNSNELAYLELKLEHENLVKAFTNAFYLKTSINFQYNDQNGRVFGNSIPITLLKNPIYPTAEVKINELISLALQAFSLKQLQGFQSLYSSAKLNYTLHSGDVSSINCRVIELDTDGEVKKSTETAITYIYSN